MRTRNWMRFLMRLTMWVIIVGYIVVASSYCNRKRGETLCLGMKVRVTDSAERKFITPDMVKGWFAEEGIKVKGEEVTSINTAELQRFVLRRGFVKDAAVYVTMDGFVHIELSQRQPVMRVERNNGRGFYITNDNYILPVQRHFVVYVPVVTGNFGLPFAEGYVGYLDEALTDEEKKSSKNYLFMGKLINFVEFVSDNDFWRSQIVQVNVREVAPARMMTLAAAAAAEKRYVASYDADGFDPWTSRMMAEISDHQVEIVPRAGDHVIMLGALDGYRNKLVKLSSFYSNAVRYVGWDSFGYVNLKYEGQVICTK